MLVRACKTFFIMFLSLRDTCSKGCATNYPIHLLLVENISTGTNSFLQQPAHALPFMPNNLKICGFGFHNFAHIIKAQKQGSNSTCIWVGTTGNTAVLCFFTLNIDAEADSATPEGPPPLPLQAEGLENFAGKALY